MYRHIFLSKGDVYLRKLSAWLCFVGGMLWSLKPLYDWLILDRRINTGYVGTDISDYIKFTFPLLCLGGLFVLFSLYKNKVRKSVIILAVALLLNGLFHFFEIYYSGSAIPFGLLFMFSGTIFLLIGAITLVIQLKANEHIPRSLFWLAKALLVSTLLFCIFPFVQGSFSDELLTPIMVVLMMFVGFIWAIIGVVLIKIINKGSSDRPKSLGT